MKIEPAVREQTKAVAVGVLILTVLMIGVFLVIGQFDWTVLTGAALGAVTGIANFFLMAMTLQKAADGMENYPAPAPEAEEGQEDEKDAPLSEGAKKGRSSYRLSYALRMLGVGAVAALGVALPFFNTYAVLIPLLFPGLVIRVIGMRAQKGG